MAEKPVVLKKLPGNGAGLLGRTALWEGPNYLLLVTSWPGGEGYRRFFYNDIQAVILRRTPRRLILNLVILAFLLIGVVPMVSYVRGGGDDGMYAVAVIYSIVLLIFLLISWLKGPTCEMHFQTAIQREKIPTVRRLRAAKKLLARLQPLIIAAQPVAAAPAAATPTNPEDFAPPAATTPGSPSAS